MAVRGSASTCSWREAGSVGGRRGTCEPAQGHPNQPLLDLLAAVRQLTTVPLVAAGGPPAAEDVDGVLRVSDSRTAQLGTAFLLADEAGTSPVHRAALRTGSSPKTF